jgi:glycosyltransferase involved in cell wall biosynthesis
VPQDKSQRGDCVLSIIIKALNEERNIALAIESALDAIEGIDPEVILADSCSTDRTVEIARRYPIKIVSLSDRADRSCGVGAQLGFQYSKGRYLCLIDGDMRLRHGFLPAAIKFLEEHPKAAGVGGLIIECETESLEFAQRARRKDLDRRPGTVTRLDCSGVYRRSAIDSMGYLTDRNLHAGEEFDLGARLHSQGWALERLDLPAVDHSGHSGSSLLLLLRRFTTRMSFGTGEVMRAAFGRPHFYFIIRNDKNLVLVCFVLIWWLTIAAIPFVRNDLFALLAAAVLFLLPFVVMSWRWRSLPNGVYSVVAWNVLALGFFPGLLRSRVSPKRWINSTIVKEVG